MNRRGPITDHQARWDVGALEQRVYGLEQSIGGISQQIGALSQKIDAKGQTNWSVLTGFAVVTISILGLLGNQALSPIKDVQNDMRLAIVEMAKQIGGIGEKFVSIRELDGRSARTTSELARINSDIKAIDSVTVPRVEQAERMRSVDAQFVAQQRQIDDIKKAFGDTFSLRDALLQMQRRIDQLETLRRPS